ncbi:MAG: endonuclease III [Planctomycetaceae bacterium]|jgi:endonuclease-3|nr:endonuclease III [Planctomycetaceae bacterium]
MSAKADTVLNTLRSLYPDAACSLMYRNPLELLIATILSAQCTDIQVNKVTPALFAKYRSAEDFASAPIKEFESAIRTTGFFHNKAKNIQGACQMIMQHFGGSVPDSMDALVLLPGVGRKTANVVLSNAFGINAGFVVDTHVFRISRRLALAKGSTPEKVEQELCRTFRQSDWGDLSHLLIQFGRSICTARNPKCGECPLKSCAGRLKSRGH